MMKYFQPINLGDAWQKIQARYHDLDRDIIGTRVTMLKEPELKWLNQTLAQAITAYSKDLHQVKMALLFATPERNNPHIHLDGTKTLGTTAVNIPIREKGQMQWFTGKYTVLEQNTSTALKYLQIIWQEQPKMICETEIDQPTLVRIDQPHRVKNLSTKPRLLLTVRWEPDLILAPN